MPRPVIVAAASLLSLAATAQAQEPLPDNFTLQFDVLTSQPFEAGTRLATVELSQRRAESVKVTLASEFGIAAARMETAGRGEAEPAAPNDSAAGKASNRRVEFVKL
jgi:hypothetical protein